MPFVPSTRFVLLAVAPLVLGAVTAIEPSFVLPMLLVDLGIALVALGDAWLGRRVLVGIEREPPRIFSVGRANLVRLHLRSSARRPLPVQVNDDAAPGLAVEGLPKTVVLAGAPHPNPVPASGERGKSIASPRVRGEADARSAAGEGTPSVRHALVTYHVRPSRRGLYALGDHHLRWPTPLGLWWRQVRVGAQHPVRVYPDVQAVRGYELLARQSLENRLVRTVRLRGGENEFEALRDYQRDDEYRAIDWKATARRQKLIAREYQQERNQSVLCLLDCGRLMSAESQGLSQLDHALNAVLMLAHVATRAGDQVGLCAFDEKVRAYLPPQGGRRAAQRVVAASYDIHAQIVETDFEAAYGFVSQRLRKRSLVVLFSQVIDDVSARAVARTVRGLGPRHLPLAVLFRDEALEQMAEPRGVPGKPAEIYQRAAAAEAILWRDRLARDLQEAGALVLHVSPRKLTLGLINRYLRIKAQRLL
ncbi:MAG: DUF58 domain-containing protein [Deltaproteobacteria bacterium]|nr:DUF58 domain-containing protein [Deltaproteobacteria bacterium]